MTPITVITPTLPERLPLMRELWDAMEAQTCTEPKVAWLVLTDIDRIGPVEMFNRLAKNVHTEWLFPLGDDDLVDPDHFATLIPWLDDDADIVYTWCRVDGPQDYPAERFQVRLQAEVGWEGLRERNWIPASAAIRTSLWRQLGGYRVPDWTNHEDWDFWVRALDVGARFRCVPATTWTYRLSERWSHVSHGGKVTPWVAVTDE